MLATRKADGTARTFGPAALCERDTLTHRKPWS